MSDTIAYMDNHAETKLPTLEKTSSGNFAYPVINLDGQYFAVIPTRLCLLDQVNVNARTKRDLDAAIPFALEDRLAEPVEDLEFIYSEQNEDGFRYVLVCRKDKITHWKQCLQGQDVIIIPEVLALPIIQDCWTVLIDNNRALVRTGLYSGYECSLACLNSQLALSLKQNTIPEAIDYWIHESVTSPSMPESFSGKYRMHYYQGSFADFLHSHAETVDHLGIQVNKIVNGSKSRSWKKWVPAIAILLFAFIFHVVSTFHSASSFNIEAEKLQQQAESVFRQTFPDARRIVNMRVQTEQVFQKLVEQELTPDSGFFDLFSKTMFAVASVEAMKVNTINWQQGTLLLQVSAASVADIELIKTRMQAENYTVDMLNAVNQGKEYTAQLKIRKAG